MAACSPSGAFLDWLKSGKGFVGMHSAADTFHGFQGYLDMLGAEFETHKAQVEINPQSFQDTASDLKLQGIVAKEPQVPRAAPRRDPQPHRLAEAERCPGRQRIQVRLDGGFQLGLPARLRRQPAQPIQDDHDDLRLPANDLVLKEIEAHHSPQSAVQRRPVPETKASKATLTRP